MTPAELDDLERKLRGKSTGQNVGVTTHLFVAAADALATLRANVEQWQQICRDDARDRDALHQEVDRLRAELAAPASDEVVEASRRLTSISVGGCTCGAKTATLSFHDAKCRYRIAEESDALLRRLDRALRQADERITELTAAISQPTELPRLRLALIHAEDEANALRDLKESADRLAFSLGSEPEQRIVDLCHEYRAVSVRVTNQLDEHRRGKQ